MSDTPPPTPKESADPKASADALRMRVLEYQIEFLRRELEFVNARHAATIYSAAWHLAWPVRKIEQAVRSAYARHRQRVRARRAALDTLKPPQPAKSLPVADAGAPLDAQALADRIASRMTPPR